VPRTIDCAPLRTANTTDNAFAIRWPAAPQPYVRHQRKQCALGTPQRARNTMHRRLSTELLRSRRNHTGTNHANLPDVPSLEGQAPTARSCDDDLEFFPPFPVRSRLDRGSLVHGENRHRSPIEQSFNCTGDLRAFPRPNSHLDPRTRRLTPCCTGGCCRLISGGTAAHATTDRVPRRTPRIPHLWSGGLPLRLAYAHLYVFSNIATLPPVP